jgi:hypothetical protein
LIDLRMAQFQQWNHDVESNVVDCLFSSSSL